MAEEEEQFPDPIKVKHKDIFVAFKRGIKRIRDLWDPAPLSEDDGENDPEPPAEFESGGQDRGQFHSAGVRQVMGPQASPTEQTSGQTSGAQTTSTNRTAAFHLARSEGQRMLQGPVNQSLEERTLQPMAGCFSEKMGPTGAEVGITELLTPKGSNADEEEEAESLKSEEDLATTEEDYQRPREGHSARTTNPWSSGVGLETLEITPINTATFRRNEDFGTNQEQPEIEQDGVAGENLSTHSSSSLLLQQLETPIPTLLPRFPPFAHGSMPHISKKPRTMPPPPTLPTQHRMPPVCNYRGYSLPQRSWAHSADSMDHLSEYAYRPDVSASYPGAYPNTTHGIFSPITTQYQNWGVKPEGPGGLERENSVERPGTPRPKAPKQEDIVYGSTPNTRWYSAGGTGSGISQAQEGVYTGAGGPLEMVVESAEEGSGTTTETGLNLLKSRSQTQWASLNPRVNLEAVFVPPYGASEQPFGGTTG